MRKLTFTTSIAAPRERVWHVMLDDTTYRQWTTAFSEGSCYEGSWDEGHEIRFLDGKGNGMVSRIAESRPPEFVSIEHLGLIVDGREDRDSEEVRTWAGARESYTLLQQGDTTEVRVDIDIDEQHAAMFEDLWPRALEKLKTLSERG
jgi:uncharacterized protein YndB with AHSA1/START domain